MIKNILRKLMDKRTLNDEEANEIFRSMIAGKLTDAQISCLLTALNLKGESPVEIAAAAKVMRENSLKVDTDLNNLVDTCGTGGDNSNCFNVSTGAAFIAAAAGVKIAKHGNRAASSKSGSADLLEEAGAEINLPPEKVAMCIKELGIGFMFAPNHHKATKRVVAIRKELGIRTLFNLIGPLTNPARVSTQVIGIYDLSLLETYLQVLRRLDCKRALVVASRDGLDEISIGSSTILGELRNDKYEISEVVPENFGIKKHSNPQISVENPKESLEMIQSAFSGQDGAGLDMLVINAAAIIYIDEKGTTFRESAEIARKVVQEGSVLRLFNQYIEKTKKLAIK